MYTVMSARREGGQEGVLAPSPPPGNSKISGPNDILT